MSKRPTNVYIRRVPATGYRGDDDERFPRDRETHLRFSLSWKRAKQELREEDERRDQVREHAQTQRQCVPPEPTMENGVRQWASSALLRRLRSSGGE